jgi:hypothetical protein
VNVSQLRLSSEKFDNKNNNKQRRRRRRRRNVGNDGFLSYVSQLNTFYQPVIHRYIMCV